MEIQQHFRLLGLQVQDKVTGFKGVVSSIGFDLYGCVQAIVTPEAGKEGALPDSRWFDVARLTTLADTPVMALPNFEFGASAEGLKGPADKPLQSNVVK